MDFFGFGLGASKSREGLGCRRGRSSPPPQPRPLFHPQPPPQKKTPQEKGEGDNTPTVHADDDEEYEWGGRFSLAWDRVLPLRAACFPAALAERAFFLGRWVGGWVGSGVLMDMYFLDVCGCGGFLGGVGGVMDMYMWMGGLADTTWIHHNKKALLPSLSLTITSHHITSTTHPGRAVRFLRQRHSSSTFHSPYTAATDPALAQRWTALIARAAQAKQPASALEVEGVVHATYKVVAGRLLRVVVEEQDVGGELQVGGLRGDLSVWAGGCRWVWCVCLSVCLSVCLCG